MCKCPWLWLFDEKRVGSLVPPPPLNQHASVKEILKSRDQFPETSVKDRIDSGCQGH